MTSQMRGTLHLSGTSHLALRPRPGNACTRFSTTTCQIFETRACMHANLQNSRANLQSACMQVILCLKSKSHQSKCHVWWLFILNLRWNLQFCSGMLIAWEWLRIRIGAGSVDLHIKYEHDSLCKYHPNFRNFDGNPIIIVFPKCISSLVSEIWHTKSVIKIAMYIGMFACVSIQFHSDISFSANISSIHKISSVIH